MSKSKTILANSPFSNIEAAKRIVAFQNKAIQNQQVLPQGETPLLQKNAYTTNPIELEVQKFVTLAQKIVNESEYLVSYIDYHQSSNQPPKPSSAQVEPFDPYNFSFGDVYDDSPIKSLRVYPITPTPTKPKRVNTIEKQVEALQNKINNAQQRIQKYQDQLPNATTNKERNALVKNIKNNENTLAKYMADFEQLNQEIGIMGSTKEGSGMYGGSSNDTKSQVIKVTNNLIYLLREADLAVNTKLFPVARILNPVQKDALRRIYNELQDKFNRIPLLGGKTDESLTEAMRKLLVDLQNIL
jgi:hypothetical protein